MAEQQIPDGFRKNAQGHLIPVDMIKPIDLERDKLVLEIFARAQEVNRVLAEFKRRTFEDIQAFVDLSIEQYDAKLGGKKGNLVFYSFDGAVKVQRAVNDRIAFDERLAAAKSLVDECLADWTEHARPEIQAIIQQAFATDKQGEINTGRVLALRRLEITDERWQEAMRAIGEAVQVVGSSRYVRVYRRIGETDQYEQIPLDIASVR